MADNLTTQSTTLATVPAASAIATDDVAGVHFQKVKIDVGGDGASAALSNSNPLPVSDAGGSLTVDGTVAVSALPSGSQAAQTAITLDYDTGGGTQSMPMQGLALPGSGGAVAGGTFTNPVRVDPTGTTAQPVSDGGSSLTVDGSVSIGSALPAGNNNIGDVDLASAIPTGDNVIGRTKITDGTTVADVFDYTNSNPLAVRLTDTNGDYIAAGAGTQYTEDAASATDPIGAMQIARRRDTPAAETGTDGDNIALNATNKGEMYVKHLDSIPVTDNGSSLTVDGSVSLTGSLPAGTANIGDVDVLTVPAPLNVTGGGTEAAALRVTLANDSTGVLSVDDNGATLSVDDGGGSLTVDGTVTANLAAGTNNIGDVDVLTLPSIPAGNNNIGDVDIASIAAGDNNIGNVDIVTMPNVTLAAGTNTNEVVGDAAHGAAVAGNPLLNGFEARTADGTAVTNGQVVRGSATTLGKQIAYPYAQPGLEWRYAAASGGITNTTGVTAKAAVASTRNYITSVQVVNGHATVSTEVEIRDGASGTVMWRGWAQAAGGGVSAKFDPPLRGSVNTLVEIANVTTGAATYFNLQGFTATE